MRIRALLLASVLYLAGGGAPTFASAPEARVLFVGNSQTYVGNLPAVFSAMANANGHAVASDMIVRGGATLTDRLNDGTIAKTLDKRRYVALVLQERGGDLICAFGPRSCTSARASLATIARMAKAKGVTSIVLLGTYQSAAMPSRALAEQEAAAAAEAGIAHVEVSQTLRCVVEAQPSLAWLHADGSHPGKDLTLLKAMLLHRQLFGTLPAPRSVLVSAPVYGVQSGLTETLRAADAPAPKAGTRRAVHFPAESISLLLDALASER